jgi:hypothetical protein
MAGGFAMCLVGVLYLTYQDSVLGRAVPKTCLSRRIIGTQVSAHPY